MVYDHVKIDATQNFISHEISNMNFMLPNFQITRRSTYKLPITITKVNYLGFYLILIHFYGSIYGSIVRGFEIHFLEKC